MKKFENLGFRDIGKTTVTKKEQCNIGVVSFELFQDLYDSYVQMNDRFETVHIWNKELSLKNKGRWIPILISKQKYDQEKQYAWNIY